ncbi:polyprenyl synthetase family protein [Anaerolinea sp.]|uniref:polyprenyl synthetase family protein n=1 Tax=Anaerolinea sp. TaxID=1872519 RepID=UPI002ACD9B92|nr:polyprenyl synthetase family protein [Anaerolinea sp.]
MMLNQVVQEMLPRIEEELRQVIEATSSPNTPQLSAMLRYHLGWEGEGAGQEAQGKRIRPLLVLLSAQAVGGKWEQALPAAAAVELVHNFSLIHDDIQDQSTLRRGRPTVWVKWGIAQAINAGDAMFTQAFWALNRLEQTISSQTALEASRILHQVCLRLTEGQYLDLAYEKVDTLPLEAYWPMVGGKTAALLGGCVELGGLCSHASPEQRTALREFGENLGLAFQVLDDWLGIWGDAALTGKSTDSDLVSGKKSLPVLYGLANSETFSQRWRRGKITSEEVNDIAGLLQDCGAEAFTLNTAEELTQKALDALNRAFEQNRERSLLLSELAKKLLSRKS